jgi:hypothetical protein
MGEVTNEGVGIDTGTDEALSTVIGNARSIIVAQRYALVKAHARHSYLVCASRQQI